MNDFPKAARIRKKREYLAFFDGSEVKKLGACVVYRRKNETTNARLGITIKSRTTSILRNRLKRQIREIFRLNRMHLGQYDYNVVVSGKYAVNYSTPLQVREKLKSIWTNENPF